MKQIIIATHGQYSVGLKDAIEVLTGAGHQITALTLRREDHIEDYETRFVDEIEGAEEGALVFVDMIGGSPYNVAMKYQPQYKNYQVISGVNLAMVVEVMEFLDQKSLSELSHMAKEAGQKAIEDFGERLEPAVSLAQAEETARQAGVTQITLARVDHRLLHGQVVTKWSKIANPTAIIIVDDALAQDEYLIEVYRSSAPTGVEVIVAPTEVIGYAYEHQTMPKGNVMLLFRDLVNVQRAYEAGLILERLQLGGIPNDGTKQMVFQAVNLSEADVAILNLVEAAGTEVYIQVVPEEAGITFQEAKGKLN